jgi:hypothetical protein
VLRLWLTGYEPAEMIGLLGVDDGKGVVNLLHRTLANLRYRFAAREIDTGRKNSSGRLGPGRRLKGDEVARSAGTRPGRAGDQVTLSKT